MWKLYLTNIFVLGHEKFLWKLPCQNMSILSRAYFWWWLEWMNWTFNLWQKKTLKSFSKTPIQYLNVRDGFRKDRFSRTFPESSIRHLNIVCTIDILWRWWFCSDSMFHQMSYLFQKQFSSLNITIGHLGLLLWPPDALSHLPPELLVILSPHFSSVHIRRGLVVGIWKLINN